MVNLKYILKICYSYSNKVQWMALYVDGKKMIESFELDKDVLLKIFKPDAEVRMLSMYEPESTLIYHLFPENEDFSYLNENTLE